MRSTTKISRPPPVDALFRAFADRTRLRMLNLLRDGEWCVCDLVDVLGVPQPKASRHLAYLRRAGLVVARKDGLWMHYRLAPSKGKFHERLLGCLADCFAEVPELRKDRGKSRLKNNRVSCSDGCC